MAKVAKRLNAILDYMKKVKSSISMVFGLVFSFIHVLIVSVLSPTAAIPGILKIIDRNLAHQLI